MIKSEFISHVLDLILDGQDEGKQTRPQMDYLSDSGFEYTDSGLFVFFTKDKGIEDFKTQKQDLVLNGVKIKIHNQNIEADAILFFKDGVIDYLEIWSGNGKFTLNEITTYELAQVWENSPKRNIKVG